MEEHDDIEFEAENNEPLEGGDAEKRMAKLKAGLEACQKERQEYLDGWQRAKADYVNALRRFEEEKRTQYERGIVKAVVALLPAFDALERAKEHLSAPQSPASRQAGSDPNEGFLVITKQLEKGFASLGLMPVGEVGEAFNPAIHEALGQDPALSAEMDDTVSAVLDKGWKVGDSVIRPAKVRVYHFADNA